jgi:hypothetical protein
MPKVMIAEERIHEPRYIAEVLADSGYVRRGIPRRCRKGSNSASGISPTLPPSIHTLLIAALSRARRNELGEPFLAADDVEDGQPLQHPSLHLC